MATKKSKTKKPYWGLRIVTVLIITAVLGISLIWRENIDRTLGLRKTELEEYKGEHSATEVIEGSGGNDLVAHFVDVGQGDACIIELPDGRTMIIDAGPSKSKNALLSYIDDTFVKGKPAANKLTEFDFAILTHSDEDHCGGFPELLKKYSVGTFYRPNELCKRSPCNCGDEDENKSKIIGNGTKTTKIYCDTLAAVKTASDKRLVTYMPSLEATGDDSITPEGLNKGDDGFYEVMFFGPYGHSYKDLNNYSPVILIEYNGKTIALSGDAEKDAEKEFVENARNKTRPKFERFTASFSVNVIKLGHHGSRTSSSEDFLNTLVGSKQSEVVVIICCGLNNSYGHPHKEVLERLKSLGFKEDKILRTDQISHIAINLSGTTTTSETPSIDEDNGLLFGGTGRFFIIPVVHEAVSWLTIAITLWLVSAFVLLAQPILAAAGIKTKKKSAR